VKEVRDRIRLKRWEHFPAAARIMARGAQSDAQLLEDVRALCAEVIGADGRARGPGSNEFELYECGLISILEALEARVRVQSSV
jgi:hypothetical protein